MSDVKNKPASILAKLKNIAKEHGIDFNLILVLYMQERFLYRLSVSRYSKNFLLKGGLLLFSIDKFNTRPTIDIDFLAYRIQNSPENLLKILTKVTRVECDDGLIFRVNDISVETIIEHGFYRGLRARITCNLGKVRNRLQIDIGFGDVVIPKPVEIQFPSCWRQMKYPLFRRTPLNHPLRKNLRQ